LTLPNEEDTRQFTRLLARGELPKRPVFVHPELLDEALDKDNAAVPAGLLFRIYADEVALTADLPGIRAALAALAAGAACEGCFARATTDAADDQLRRAYDSALRAHVTAAHQLGFETEGAELAARAHL
jgi:hypothetical protein